MIRNQGLTGAAGAFGPTNDSLVNLQQLPLLVEAVMDYVMKED